MSAYQLTTGTTVIRTGDGACIPADPGNVDYKAYLAWVAAGNAADPALTVAQAQAAQTAALQAAYTVACAQPVAYTSKGGVTKTFQADAAAVANLQAALAGLSAAQATPSGFYWLSADNTPVPFTYADLQGLAAAMLAQGWTAFQHLQAQKAAIAVATTVAAALAVVW